jgi:hypothetical protein
MSDDPVGEMIPAIAMMVLAISAVEVATAQTHASGSAWTRAMCSWRTSISLAAWTASTFTHTTTTTHCAVPKPVR